MAHLTIPAGTPIEHALEREDGSRWYAAMEREDGTIVVADTLTDLVADLIDDYPVEGGPAALESRVGFASRVAQARQATLAFVATMEGQMDTSVESEESLTALFADRELPVADMPAWENGAVPLVLLNTSYAPYTDVPAPQGNIEWIDPSDEGALLRSLTDLGDIRLWVDEA